MNTTHPVVRLSALVLAGGISMLTASAAPASAEHSRHHSAAPTAATAAHVTNTEPERVFDLGARNFVVNPARHETARPVLEPHKTNAEPRRVFDLAARNFEVNPDFHEPARRAKPAQPSAQASEPDRVFNPSTGNFEPDLPAGPHF